MFDGEHPLVHLPSGEVFIDRDPELWCYVIEFLRSGSEFELPGEKRLQRRLLNEFRYLQLPTLMFSDLAAPLSRVYTVGGCPDPHMHRPVTTISCYDTVFDGWCDVAEVPQARSCVAAATLGARLYVLGGKDAWGKELSGVTTCDLTNHEVSESLARPMATPRHTFGAATAAGRVYAVGHGRLGDEADTVEFFDPGSAAWWSAPPLKQAPRNHAVTAWPGLCGEPGGGHQTGDHSQVILSSGGYVGRPGVGLTASTDMLMLDVRTRTWTALAPMPVAHVRHGIAAAAGRVHIVGGTALPDCPSSAVHTYDMRAGRWLEASAGGPSNLPRPLEATAAVAVAGSVLVVGGLTVKSSAASSPAQRARTTGGVAAGGGGGGIGAGRQVGAPRSTSGVVLEDGLARVSVEPSGQALEDKVVQDGVLRLCPTSGAWTPVHSMRSPMHSMAAAAFHS